MRRKGRESGEKQTRKKKIEKEESREGLKKVKNIYNNTNIIEKSD